jgi:hypothetical protein
LVVAAIACLRWFEMPARAWIRRLGERGRRRVAIVPTHDGRRERTTARQVGFRSA